MEQKHRSEFPEKELWDLTALYQDREDFLRAIEKAGEDINQFSRDYIGPEGGLSPAEIESFEVKGAVLAGLGPRILRAETAPLYALSALSVLLELEK